VLAYTDSRSLSLATTRYLLPVTPRSQFAASLLFYIAVTAVIGRDVLARLSTAVANDPGDPLLTAAILHWNAFHLPWIDSWWQLPMFHPTRDTLAFSEHLLGLSAIAAPIAWITGNPLVTYNLVTLLTFVLSAAAMYLLVYRLSGSAAGAFIAGLAYGFAPFRISQLPHIQMLAGFWAPLALLGLHAFLEDGRRRWLALFAAAWMLQAAANGYALVFLSVLLGLWVLWFVVAPGRWKDLAMIAGATVAGAVPLAPILLKYIAVHAYHGFIRGPDEIQQFSADAAGVLCAPSALTFWGWLRVACRPEAELFPGAVLALLVGAAAIGVGITIWRTPATAGRIILWVRRMLFVVAAFYGAVVLSVLVFGPWRIAWPFLRASASSTAKPLVMLATALLLALLLSPGLRAAARRSSTIVFYLLAALAMWLLTLGPTIILLGESTGRRGPYAALMLLPGVDGLRAPGRFWMMSAICLAIAAGLYVATLVAGRSRRVVTIVLLVLAPALLTDGWVPRIAAQEAPPPVPDPRALAGQVVIELPLGGYYDIAAQWRAIAGGWKLINGYSGYGPAYYVALTAATMIRDDAAFRPFQRDRDLHVVVQSADPMLVAFVERQPGAVLTASNHWARQYRLPRRGGVAATAGARIPIASLETMCDRESDPVAFALDGDETTRWVCPPNARQELTVDLGTPATVGAFVQHLGAYYWEAPYSMIIETSLDGAAWTVVHNGSVLEHAIDGAMRAPRAATVLVPFAAHEARYLRVRVENQVFNYHFTMAEAEVRAPAP
jgi:hypothetical protein